MNVWRRWAWFGRAWGGRPQGAQRAPARQAGLSAVTAVPVGRKGDGLVLRPAGSALDKDWGSLVAELTDARDAWRQNPLARRMVGLITSYTVGHGITLHTPYRPLQDFIDEFWQHNRMEQRISEWSDELARSGELFPVLFTNPISGMSTVRTVPACLIEAVEYDPDDYETELRYKEVQPLSGGGLGAEKWWLSPQHPDADRAATRRPEEAQRAPRPTAVMLHFAVNRPIGAVRGESDLAPILPWLRRYNRWLEDRVRLNAAVRSFLWIVHAPSRLRTELQERYRTAPDPGSVIIAEQDAETWEAVTPTLHAADAEKDGRALRWMIVAGGPGTALLDMGEGEDSNLATGRVMAEQRRRFLRRRQAYLVYVLTQLTLEAWRRYEGAGRKAEPGEPSGPPLGPENSRSAMHPEGARHIVTAADIQAITPDISPEDNRDLAAAAQQLSAGLAQLAELTGSGPALRKVALRMFAKFAGETLTEREIETILSEGERQGGRCESRATNEG